MTAALNSPDKDAIAEKIQHVKCWIKEQSDIPELSEKMINTFLHSNYYEMAATKNTLKAYFSLRVRAPEYFSDRDPQAIFFKIHSELGPTILLPGSTDEGFRVIFSSFAHSNTRNYSFDHLMKKYFMSIDLWLSQLDTCPGYIMVCDGENSALSHFTSASLDSIKKLTSYFQEALPVRLQALVLLNVSMPLNFLLTIVKPFLTKRLANLIHKYPKNNEGYMDLIPRRMLPKDVGGELEKTVAELNEEACNFIGNHADWYKEQDKIIENLRKRLNDNK